MMLIVNMVQGSFMATIAEGLTLAQVTGQSQQTLLDILNQGQLASIFLDQKCQNILQGNFKPDFYLKYIQKDLRLAIALGDAVNHPTPMAAAANEVGQLDRGSFIDESSSLTIVTSQGFHVAWAGKASLRSGFQSKNPSGRGPEKRSCFMQGQNGIHTQTAWAPASPPGVYKRAKALDQSDNDMSAVYRAYIH
ncbi:putative oxidoreductase glyr1 [Saguinus oedipus]|uniref:Oxidoreductase glyr1 n=1 Tax=Saguinus oedipus TaxID=9490 RepID=A0ABQ9UMI2_SAGOE|nr:putative oxidoreductase glyr1 [Saguinus oedipus]